MASHGLKLNLNRVAPGMSISTSSGSFVRKPRTIVLCFDGTSNQYDGTNTNVVDFFSLLKKEDTDEQVCYYQAGIGTYFKPGVISPAFQWVAKIMDEVVAWYLDAHVMDGYKFLMQNYHAGDKICLFGFSRGAYTARAVAGMLHKVGLLPKDNDEQIPFAYKVYKRTDKQGDTLAQGFKRTFCRSVDVEFVGVWDTVASVGVLVNRTLPFTTANTTIKTFRQALSLDEHRAKFRPNLYHRPGPDDNSASPDSEHNMDRFEKLPTPTDEHKNSTHRRSSSLNKFIDIVKAGQVKNAGTDVEKNESGFNYRKSKRWSGRSALLKKGKSKAPESDATGPDETVTDDERGQDISLEEGPTNADVTVVNSDADDALVRAPCDKWEFGTNVLEVWFPGCHSDVGGGAVRDGTPHSLADITLRWMIREVMSSQCGILFDTDAMRRLGIPEFGIPAHTSPAHSPMLPPPISPITPVSRFNQTGPPLKQSRLFVDKDKSLKVNSQGLGEEGPTRRLDEIDAIQPMHDQLAWNQHPLWWLLETLPLSFPYQDSNGVWYKRWSINLGRGRIIPTPDPFFHLTVQDRENDKSLEYTPRATWTGEPTYVS